MENEEKAFTILLLAVTTLLAFFSLSYSFGTRMLPLFTGIFSSAILGFLVLTSFYPKIKSWYQKFEPKAGLSKVALNKNEKKRERSIVLWFTGCIASVYVLGFLVTIPLFLFLFLKIWARESWLLSAVFAVVVLGVVYVSFIYLLRVPLYQGIWLT